MRRTIRVPAWAWIPAAYIVCILLLAVILRFVGSAEWFAPMYWTSIAVLFLIECSVLRYRFLGVRHVGARYAVTVAASIAVTLFAAYAAIAVLFGLVGPLGWL